MTAQLSREELQRIVDTDHVQCGDAAAMARMLLAGMCSEPVAQQPELTVWYGSMPETNGKANWTAVLHRKGECMSTGITIDRSEYPDRVRYEADSMRYLIGELPDEPDILAYDANLHSGYVKPPAPVAVPDDLLHMAADAIEDLLKNGNSDSSAAVWFNMPGKLRAAMLKAGPVTGWIKCSERMPEQKQSNRYIGLNLLLNERTVVQGGFDDGSFWLDGVRIDNVTHWMPLPAAPEQE